MLLVELLVAAIIVVTGSERDEVGISPTAASPSC